MKTLKITLVHVVLVVPNIGVLLLIDEKPSVLTTLNRFRRGGRTR